MRRNDDGQARSAPGAVAGMPQAMLLYAEGTYRRATALPAGGVLLPGRAGNPFSAEPADARLQERYYIYYEAGAWWLRDQSRGGTFVNGTQIAGAVRLLDQVRIRCGGAQVRFQLLGVEVGASEGSGAPVTPESPPDRELEELRGEIERLRRQYQNQLELVKQAVSEVAGWRRKEEEWAIERRQLETLRVSWQDAERRLREESEYHQAATVNLTERLEAAEKLGRQHAEMQAQLEDANGRFRAQLEQLQSAHDAELRLSRDLRAALAAQQHIAEHLAGEKKELYHGLREQQHLVSHLQIEKQKVESQRERLLGRESQLSAVLTQTRHELDESQQRYHKLLLEQRAPDSRLQQRAHERPGQSAAQFRLRRQMAALVTTLRHIDDQDSLAPLAAGLRAQLQEIVDILSAAFLETALLKRLTQAYDRGRQFKLLCAAMSTTIDSLATYDQALRQSQDPRQAVLLKAATENAGKLARDQQQLVEQLLNDLLIERIGA